LIVEQNVRLALEISDRGYIIENGRITGKERRELLKSDKSRVLISQWVEIRVKVYTNPELWSPQCAFTAWSLRIVAVFGVMNYLMWPWRADYAGRLYDLLAFFYTRIDPFLFILLVTPLFFIIGWILFKILFQSLMKFLRAKKSRIPY